MMYHNMQRHENNNSERWSLLSDKLHTESVKLAFVVRIVSVVIHWMVLEEMTVPGPLVQTFDLVVCRSPPVQTPWVTVGSILNQVSCSKYQASLSQMLIPGSPLHGSPGIGI